MKVSELFVIVGLVTIIGFGGFSCVKSFMNTRDQDMQAAYFEKGGKTLAVEVDVTGGWTVDDKLGTAYISNGKTENGEAVTALAAPIDKMTYYNCEKNSRAKGAHQQYVYGGVLYTAPSGDSMFIKQLGKNEFFQISASHVSQAQLSEVVSRVELKYI